MSLSAYPHAIHNTIQLEAYANALASYLYKLDLN